MLLDAATTRRGLYRVALAVEVNGWVIYEVVVEIERGPRSRCKMFDQGQCWILDTNPAVVNMMR